MAPNKNLTFALPYLGKVSLDLRTRQALERGLPYCKLNVVFISKCRINILLRFKDSLEKKITKKLI